MQREESRFYSGPDRGSKGRCPTPLRERLLCLDASRLDHLTITRQVPFDLLAKTVGAAGGGADAHDVEFVAGFGVVQHGVELGGEAVQDGLGGFWPGPADPPRS